MNSDGFFQPPANAISDNRIANFFRDRKTNSRRGIISPLENFEQE